MSFPLTHSNTWSTVPLLSSSLPFLLAFLLTSCAEPDHARSRRADAAFFDSTALWKQYHAAVRDAQQVTRAEISHQLTPIAAGIESLIWKGMPGRGRVLVTTWTGRALGAAGDTARLEIDAWVTLAPQLRRFCQTLTLEGRALHVRLAQHLGLPPDVPYNHFVTLWIHPDSLFRPCPDPAVTDRACQLSPSTAGANVSTEHRRWMYYQREAAYQRPTRYPWTRLGYTYDWNPTTGEIGLSEYVIPEGTAVVIARTESTAAYCR